MDTRVELHQAICVYIVDDDEQMVANLRAAMQGQSELDVQGSAGSLAEAYALLEQGTPDIVLVDLGLPDGSGLELIRFIHKHRPGCETMVFTVFGDESHVLSSIEAGATGYLTKDTRTDDIVARLKQLRAGGSPISPVIARRLLNRFRVATPPSPESAPSQLPSGNITPLSDRELQVLEMVAKGFMQAEIADILGVSINTVSTYVKRIYRKLAVNSRTGAVHKASELGLINLRER